MNYVDGWDLVKEGLEAIQYDLFYRKPRELWKSLLIKLKLKGPPKPSVYNPTLNSKHVEQFSAMVHERALARLHAMNPYVTVQDLLGEASSHDG